MAMGMTETSLQLEKHPTIFVPLVNFTISKSESYEGDSIVSFIVITHCIYLLLVTTSE